jgi:3-hydroxybutyryl-CoA dehydratase
MIAAPSLTDFPIGTELSGPTRVVTAERMQRYGDGLLSAAAGEEIHVGANIHTNEEYARSQGLEYAIADGMLSTNWVSSMLVRSFGAAYLTTGQLQTKFIKPVRVGIELRACGRVTAQTAIDDGATRIDLEIWTEDADRTKLVVGTAAVTLTTAAMVW